MYFDLQPLIYLGGFIFSFNGFLKLLSLKAQEYIFLFWGQKQKQHSNNFNYNDPWEKMQHFTCLMSSTPHALINVGENYRF